MTEPAQHEQRPAAPRSRSAVRATLAASAAVLLVGTGVVAANTASAAVPAPSGWTQVFADDFDGDNLNLKDWQVIEGTSYPGGHWGFGTGEIERSTADNVSVANGMMTITAKGQGAGEGWTAARVETNRSDFQPPAGGKLRVEASLRLPEAPNGASNGYWPAFWMLGAPFRGNWWNWPMIGEFDIMENVSGLNRVWATMHCGTSPGGPCNEKDGVGNGGPVSCTPACTKSFHRYTLDWSRADNSATWYVDGKQVHRTQRGVNIPADVWDTATNHGFFIILNIAMGGEMPANMGVPINAETTGGGHYDAEYVAVWTGAADAPPPSGDNTAPSTTTQPATTPPATTVPPTTQPPAATTQPTATTQPPAATTQPPAAATQPPATAEPPVLAQPPATTGAPATTQPTAAAPAGNAWATWTPYPAGQIVTYNGARYQSRQSHTSLPGWEPANVLALWLPV